MRSILTCLALLASTTAATAAGPVYVHGYTTKSGTYVAPYYRSAPDHSTANNWSTKGNVNPYTGEEGTKNPYSSYSPSYTPRYTSPTYPAPSFGCSYSCPSTQSSSDDEDPQ